MGNQTDYFGRRQIDQVVDDLRAIPDSAICVSVTLLPLPAPVRLNFHTPQWLCLASRLEGRVANIMDCVMMTDAERLTRRVYVDRVRGVRSVAAGLLRFAERIIVS